MRISDSVTGVLLLVFGVTVFWLTSDYPGLDDGYPGPSLFPRVLALLMIVSGIMLVGKSIRSKNTTEKVFELALTADGVVNLCFGVGAVVLYLVVSKLAGFLIAGTFVTAALMVKLGVRIRTAVLSTLIAVAFVYLLFVQILRVPLPVSNLF